MILYRDENSPDDYFPGDWLTGPAYTPVSPIAPNLYAVYCPDCGAAMLATFTLTGEVDNGSCYDDAVNDHGGIFEGICPRESDAKGWSAVREYGT